MGDPAQSGGITYSEWMGTLSQVKPSRPPCPVCGGTHTISSSHQWLCRDCGKYYSKARKERDLPDYSARPQCPRCGAYHANRQGGARWMCGKCGRQWKVKTG